MPIYEFYCNDCHTIFSFFSKTINTTTVPPCPHCAKTLARQVSAFAVTGKAKEHSDADELPLDEKQLEKAVMKLGSEAENLNEEDPRAAANLMRKFSDMTGVKFGDGMQEALQRLESGEDPDKIEAEMGDILENEDPLLMPGTGGTKHKGRRKDPQRDETLYDL
ncbi:MAG: zinc ribbon domain-containing protein [Deltaproteobacteria bacterium]|nr:zinc ribbon domain-containing protein [Deltaproteobacteria bacterium]